MPHGSHLSCDQENGLNDASDLEDGAQQVQLPRYTFQVERARQLRRFLHAGLRVSKASNLPLSHIEISERKRQLTVGHGKGGKHRLVPLNADVRKAMAEYLEVRPDARHDYLFVGKRKGRLKPWGMQSLASKYAYLARLDKVTPHTQRQRFGNNLVDAGVSLDKVATLVAHKNLNTTQMYTKPNSADSARAIEKLKIR